MQLIHSAEASRPLPVQLPYPGRFRAAPERQAGGDQRLPFTVSVVETDEALEAAFNLAQSAYGRHVPDLLYPDDVPSMAELDEGYLVLLARSKFDNSPVGTMKIQRNSHTRLNIERSLKLPLWLEGSSQAGANRLGVAAGSAGRMVKLALFKAYYLYCVQEEIDWMVIAARQPLDRAYADLLFKDVFGENEFLPLAHAANIPHRVMAFEVATAGQRWKAAQHPLHDFIFATRHPDITVDQLDLSLPLGEATVRHLNAA